MRASVERIGMAVAIAAVIAAWAPVAGAYFPIGGYDSFGVLRYATWPLSEFDTNNDGDVDQGEGLDILIEGGKSGFTTEEIEIVEEAFQVWQDVPTCYAAFRMAGVVQDPLLSGSGTPDFLTVIALQLTEEDDTGEDVVPDPADVVVGEVAFPVLGLTTTLYTIDETALEVAGEIYVIAAGTIIDVDIIINGTAIRNNLGVGEVDLKGVLVHEIGHLLGLGHTPLNNLREERTGQGTGDIVSLVENEVFWQTSVDGIGRTIGVTPTMFPIYFNVEATSGPRYNGMSDLAPDDISGISALYPRGSQANFFTLKHEARSHTRAGTGLPSVPLPGGHVVAWADADNDVNTPRVPVFSTMTGLYEKTENPQLEGWFELRGLWKQMEIPGTDGVLFNPSYAITLNPLNATGFDRQAPEGLEATAYDSIQGEGSFSATTRSEYINAFTSEVFHEVENVFDVSQKDAGTPLIWSFESNTLISGDTGKTLATILPNKEPMFGDPNDVCPLNVIQSGATGGTTTTAALLGPNRLRVFRDKVLLESSLGAAVVEAYYRVSPIFAKFLLRHGQALEVFRSVMLGVYWMIDHVSIILGAAGAVFIALWWRRRRARLPQTLLLLAAMLAAPTLANADIAYVTTAQMAAASDQIIIGKVVSSESRWSRGGRIYTDIVIQIEETAKGDANKASYLSLSVLGGQIGGIVMQVHEMPHFNADEEVLLYLHQGANDETTVYAGARGKQTIASEDGKKYVLADREDTKRAMQEDAEVMKAKDADTEADDEISEGRVPLNEYLAYLRCLVRDQKRQAK